MLIGFRQPKTKGEMKTNDELLPSAPFFINTMLAVRAFCRAVMCQN
jgi:hypothetical protein